MGRERAEAHHLRPGRRARRWNARGRCADRQDPVVRMVRAASPRGGVASRRTPLATGSGLARRHQQRLQAASRSRRARGPCAPRWDGPALGSVLPDWRARVGASPRRTVDAPTGSNGSDTRSAGAGGAAPLHEPAAVRRVRRPSPAGRSPLGGTVLAREGRDSQREMPRLRPHLHPSLVASGLVFALHPEPSDRPNGSMPSPGYWSSPGSARCSLPTTDDGLTRSRAGG